MTLFNFILKEKKYIYIYIPYSYAFLSGYKHARLSVRLLSVDWKQNANAYVHIAGDPVGRPIAARAYIGSFPKCNRRAACWWIKCLYVFG